MKIAVLACVVAVALAMPSSDQEWEEYKAKYGKNYESNDEESVRRDNYYKSKELVEKHNELYNQGLESYTLVLNRFADMTPAEVAKKMNGLIPSDSNVEGELHEASNNSLPASVDWRTKGVVTPVKDQQDCGGCWAFSSTGSLEAHWALAKGKLVSLSEQNLIDCSQDEGNNGCDGGLMTNAFEYIKKNHGVDSESSYPFADETETCSFDKKNVAATLSSWKNIAQGSEANLQDAVATKGPVSVGIDARGNNFHLYGGGIYNSQQCSSIKLDHAVLVVGYGTENGKDYWLVKNSWGTGWGEDGYIRMTRNGNNQCGIASLATYPIV